jgi:hypothetical protein
MLLAILSETIADQDLIGMTVAEGRPSVFEQVVCERDFSLVVAYGDLMKIPGIARVWTTTETLAALSCVKREGAGLRLSAIGKTKDDLRK